MNGGGPNGYWRNCGIPQGGMKRGRTGSRLAMGREGPLHWRRGLRERVEGDLVLQQRFFPQVGVLGSAGGEEFEEFEESEESEESG